MMVGLVSGALIATGSSVPAWERSVTAWETSSVRGLFSVRGEVVAGAHRLVTGEDRAQDVDGRVAELGGRGEQLVGARRLSGFAALDVAPDEGGDREVLLGEFGAFGRVEMVALDHRSDSLCSARSGHDPLAGIASQSRACSR